MSGRDTQHECCTFASQAFCITGVVNGLFALELAKIDVEFGVLEAVAWTQSPDGQRVLCRGLYSWQRITPNQLGQLLVNTSSGNSE